MKSLKFIAIVALSFMVMSFTGDGSSALVWKSEEVNLGKISQGKPVTVKFEFTNTGKETVIISNVATSCGCTVADYSKEPIPPNKQATITATYNAANIGDFTKAITVTFANNETKILNIKGTVVQP
jgi:hypothetical protein